ncbi:MAG: DUF5060 domain-containing protein [Verrucomicrobiota bacterium JB022]|nr:DUF5060 domain-containing protein [Verrucomicrobiota bacterium JB022]
MYLRSPIYCLAAATTFTVASPLMAALTAPESVPQYRVFEASVTNDQDYDNKFTDVKLEVRYQSPGGDMVYFSGFYDGDGVGGGDFDTGNVWKMRFMPDKTGTWQYFYRWSDGTPGGKGKFEVVEEGAGKGIIQAYEENPRWFAYNGTEPVWLKSYYETGHGSIGQNFDWIVENVYQPLVDHGYNHLQINWLLSLCCFGQYYLDGPEPETLDLLLYEEGEVTTTMNFDVWRRMEQHLGWLNDRDVGVHMFLGFDGSRNMSSAWTALTDEEKDFYVHYVVSRLAPYANIAGWNYVWEVPGDREDEELGWVRLVQKYDVFNHLRTYEDEFPRENEYHREEYTFAAVENHHIAAPEKPLERHLWRDAWTHHMACILGYKGKPVFMSEGNSLWRRFWHDMVGATRDDLRRSAWACATAGASFTWNGHAKEYELYAGGPDGLPFNDENEFKESERHIQILTDVMTKEVDFFRMHPHDELLAKHQVLRVYLLAEPGEQYLVFAPDGEQFAIEMEPGEYANNVWIDSKTGRKVKAKAVTSKSLEEPVDFTAPDKKTDWVLVVRR